jgi:mediator of RNA polymerase II transcription subunit 7
MAATNPGASEGGESGEAQLLVSEFPPPPFYYKQAQTLTPPPIPVDALERGTKRAAAAASKAREESERMRLGLDTPNTESVLGGKKEDEDDGEVVAVFGEIVEVRDSKRNEATRVHLGLDSRTSYSRT